MDHFYHNNKLKKVYLRSFKLQPYIKICHRSMISSILANITKKTSSNSELIAKVATENTRL